MTGRVLFSCFPGYGHLNPLLPLAGAYREAGAEVTVATGPEMCAEAERHGFAACPVGLSGRDIEQRFLVAHPEYEELGPFERFAVLLSGMFVEVAANERLADLLTLCRSWSPGVLIHDTLELAGPVVAAALGLPAVTHGANLARPTAEGLAIATVALTPLWEEAGATGTAEALIDNPYLDICPPGLAGSEPVAFPTVIPIRAVTGGASDDAELEQDSSRCLTSAPRMSRSAPSSTGHPGCWRAWSRALGPSMSTWWSPRARAGMRQASVHSLRRCSFARTSLTPPSSRVVTRSSATPALARSSPPWRTACRLYLFPSPPTRDRTPRSAATAGAATTLNANGLRPDAVAAALASILEQSEPLASARRIAVEIADMPSPAEVVSRLSSL